MCAIERNIRMSDKTIIEILSAGVVASLVTGIFSLIIAIKNNRKLLDIEKSKQRFTITQERFKALKEAYSQLLDLLPEDQRTGYIIMNLPLQDGFEENGLASSYEVAEQNIKILHNHFQRHGYLLSENEQNSILDFTEELDSVAKNLINAKSDFQVYNIEESETSNITRTIAERIIKITEFEEMYFSYFRNSLSKMSKLDEKAKSKQ